MKDWQRAAILDWLKAGLTIEQIAKKYSRAVATIEKLISREGRACNGIHL